MTSFPRPAWRNRAVPLLVLITGVLVLLLCMVGAGGPAARVIPVVFGAVTAGAAVWAVYRWRSDRAEYERRLTAWAAAEAVLAERLRIAGDLHDLVSHGLGLITVRAAATRHLEQSPEIRAALGDIEQTSRDATAELRRMLTVLREPESAPLAPADSLGTLPEIVRAARAAGLRPSLTTGELGEVAPGVQVAICRTVREGLANVARHAGPAGVAVRVHRDGRHVVVTVADEGPAPGWRAVPGAGHGLAGLRERVGALDGSLIAEPVEGGYRLTVRLPDGMRTA
ncbi:sensor histidine kinase [Actinoplanes couchii]|uniref:histidine kinase n=1 Tax=Actinoplanes couchii TaxID=403638 RepID=A0ABQ3XFM7_9ACTN|nr:histidine kinase [Actinoplanes couchii]MDR6321755.1 signal transduction histidine kinase [Actinoplanes couchii]GID57287.1 hypothetical protein Aco03nite_056910 [Actinoplanes couchii]